MDLLELEEKLTINERLFHKSTYTVKLRSLRNGEKGTVWTKRGWKEIKRVKRVWTYFKIGIEINASQLSRSRRSPRQNYMWCQPSCVSERIICELLHAFISKSNYEGMAFTTGAVFFNVHLCSCSPCFVIHEDNIYGLFSHPASKRLERHCFDKCGWKQVQKKTKAICDYMCNMWLKHNLSTFINSCVVVFLFYFPQRQRKLQQKQLPDKSYPCTISD